MKRSLMRAGCLAAALAVVMCALTPAVEASKKRHGEIGVMGGFFVPDADLSAKPESVTESEPLFGLRGAYLFAPHWGWFVDANYTDINTHSAAGDADIANGRTGFEYYFREHCRKLVWYVGAGAGRMNVEFEGAGVQAFDRTFASFSTGQRFALDHRARVRWELRGDWTLDDAGLGGADLATYQLNIGIIWGIGVGRPPEAEVTATAAADPDLDNDGVPDVSDPEPHNPDICGDSDGDTCDDCAIGTDDFGPLPDNTPDNDGPDADADGLCDAGDADADNDGVPNANDLAWLVPTICADVDGDSCDDCSIGRDGFGPLRDGDPANDGPDRDSDGFCDVGDRCPDEPAALRLGCPEDIPPADSTPLVLKGIFFEFDKTRLLPESMTVLDRVARSLVSHPGVRVEIGGHTDSVGTTFYNLDLSRRRAEAVRGYLVDRGVDHYRLEVRGYGEHYPRATNDTDEGRSLNRRVEMKRMQ